jgi:hypothetical protein
MKSLRPVRVLLIAGLLASSAVFVSACSVDGTGLEQVEDGGSDGSEPDGTGPSANTDAGDATTEDGSDAASPDDGSSAEAGDGGAKRPGADAAPDADAGDATIATDGEVDATVDAGRGGGLDAAEPDVVGDGPTPVDAPEDVAIPEDAEDANTADTSVEDSSVDADFVDAGSDAETATTTSVIASALGDACAYGALLANCLTTQCENLPGMTGSSSDTSLCLATLACALSGSTATTYCGMRSDTMNECYCGDADPPDCQGGLADGVCIAPEGAGFSPNDPASIYASYMDTTQPSGLANYIANCMASVPLCQNAAGLQ